MFFSLATVEVVNHLVWQISGLVLHDQVLTFAWIVMAISIFSIANLKLVPNGLKKFLPINISESLFH